MQLHLIRYRDDSAMRQEELEVLDGEVRHADALHFTRFQELFHVFPGIDEVRVLVYPQNTICVVREIYTVCHCLHWIDHDRYVPPILVCGQCIRYRSIYSTLSFANDSSNASRTRSWCVFLRTAKPDNVSDRYSYFGGAWSETNTIALSSRKSRCGVYQTRGWQCRPALHCCTQKPENTTLVNLKRYV